MKAVLFASTEERVIANDAEFVTIVNVLAKERTLGRNKKFVPNMGHKVNVFLNKFIFLPNKIGTCNAGWLGAEANVFEN